MTDQIDVDESFIRLTLCFLSFRELKMNEGPMTRIETMKIAFKELRFVDLTFQNAVTKNFNYRYITFKYRHNYRLHIKIRSHNYLF